MLDHHPRWMDPSLRTDLTGTVTWMVGLPSSMFYFKIKGALASILRRRHFNAKLQEGCVVLTGFLDMLTRAQCSRVDDQRGLLTKEQLEVPLFLQLSSDQRKEDRDPEETSTACPNKGELKEEKGEAESPPWSDRAAVETPDSDQDKPKDLKETTV